MMELTEEMVAGVVLELFGGTALERHGATLTFARPFARKDFCELVRATAGVDVGRAPEGELRAAVERRNVAEAATLAGPKLIDEVFKTYAEPTLVQPTFVLDYPIALSPLAKPRRGDPAKAERWELFIQGREMANAFSELNDPDEQRGRFEGQARLRAAGGEGAPQGGGDFLRALGYGMPPAGGAGPGGGR